ncbi:hypothetical protein HY008_03430 [Candidatus Woesebacteria bacterium]|nr:hypothetical protein [Candidatus Woesebacteria bacterium]
MSIEQEQSSATQDFDSTKEENSRLNALMHNPWFWVSTGIVAIGGAGLGTWKVVERLRSHRLQQSTVDKSALLTDVLEDHFQDIPKSRYGALKGIVSSLIKKFSHDERGIDLRSLVRALHPLKQVHDETQALREELPSTGTISGFEGIDLQLLRRFFSQVSFVPQEVTLHLEQEYRDKLKKNGYEVSLVPTGRREDWEAMGKIMLANWKFPTLTRILHGIDREIKESKDFGPEAVEFPQAWLVIKKDSGRGKEVVGYASFLALRGLDEHTDLADFSFEDALGKRADTIHGNTLMVTSVTKAPAANTDTIATAFFGLQDLAKRHQTQTIIIPALSPSVKTMQQDHGGWYRYWWSRMDEEGLYTDPWHLVLSYFAHTGPVNERFMEFKVGADEVWTMFGQNDDMRRLPIDERARLLIEKKSLFLDASPVPLQKIDGYSYQCRVPAGWMIMNPRSDLNAGDRKVELLR